MEFPRPVSFSSLCPCLLFKEPLLLLFPLWRISHSWLDRGVWAGRKILNFKIFRKPTNFLEWMRSWMKSIFVSYSCPSPRYCLKASLTDSSCIIDLTSWREMSSCWKFWKIEWKFILHDEKYLQKLIYYLNRTFQFPLTAIRNGPSKRWENGPWPEKYMNFLFSWGAYQYHASRRPQKRRDVQPKWSLGRGISTAASTRIWKPSGKR